MIQIQIQRRIQIMILKRMIKRKRKILMAAMKMINRAKRKKSVELVSMKVLLMRIRYIMIIFLYLQATKLS
jgi:hypothetical protein